MFVPFAEWAPDIAALNTNVTDEVMNVLPAAGSYIPFPNASVFSDPLPAKPLGFFMGRTLSGRITIFAGTATKLYRLNNTTLAWDDISQTATTYSANDDAPWSFAQFGEYVIAVNRNDDPQVYQLGISTEFADLGGNPPRANKVRVWGDFLVLLQLTSNPNRVHWSAINDIEEWTPGTLNSDFQDFPDGGVIQDSSEATNPLIILERAIYLGTFAPGSVEVFTFVKIHDRRGSVSDKSVAARGAFLFYADSGSFFQIGPDGAIFDIGFEKIARTVFGSIEATDIANIRGVVDPFYSRVYWAADVGAVGHYNRLYIYDWHLKRWTQAEIEIVGHFQAATPGYTLESLDDISSSLDALPFSLDSRVWQGGAPLLAAFNTSYELISFNGNASAATLTTQEMGDSGGRVTFIREIYPVVDTADLTIATGSRFRRSDNVSWSTERAPSAATGMVMGRSRGRFHRFRVTIASGALWTHAQGIDVTPQQAGTR